MTVCRGFSVGRLYPCVHVDPRAFGDVFVDWPCHPKCTPRCLHSRAPSWALAMNFCLCKYTKARKTLDEGSVQYLAPRFCGANYNLIPVCNNIFYKVYRKFPNTRTRCVESRLFEWGKCVCFSVKKLEYKWLFRVRFKWKCSSHFGEISFNASHRVCAIAWCSLWKNSLFAQQQKFRII